MTIGFKRLRMSQGVLISRVALCLCATTLVWAVPTASLQASKASAIQIHKLVGRLHLESGQLSAPIRPDFDYWNGDAFDSRHEPIGAFNAVVLDIQVKAGAGVEGWGQSVQLEVRNAKNKLIEQKTFPLKTFGVDGLYHLAHVVQTPVCEPLNIAVHLKGQAKATLLKLPLACGE